MIDNYVNLNEKEKELFERFYIIHKEASFNLTAIKDRSDFYIKHYLDSIYIFKNRNFNFSTLLDIGTGGGFPGLVIGIINPLKKIYLVESKKKKCAFLEGAVNELALKNIAVVNKRVEELKDLKADIITARAVDTIKNIIKRSLHLAKENSIWILYKGEFVDGEVKEASTLLFRLGLKIEKVRYDEPIKRSYIIISH